MRLAEGGISRPPADDGEVVAFPASDLRGEDFVQGLGEFRTLRDGHRGLLGVHQPVEVTPDFTAVDFLRTVGLGQTAERFQAAEGAPDMRVMLVGEVMEIDDLRSAGFEEAEEVIADDRLAGVTYRFARMAELSHEAVLADHCGGVLLADTFRGDLVVGPILELAGAGASAPVGDGHSAEPAILLVVAGEDAMEGHELQVVLVGADAEVGRPTEGFRGGEPVRDHEAGARVERDHRRREGREAAATAWPWRLSFSEGTRRSMRSSGNSSRRTVLACSMMMLPPWPEVTRPMISRQLIS